MGKFYLDMDEDEVHSKLGIAVFSYCNTIKLIWEINQHVPYAFERGDDLLNRKDETSSHTQYVFFHEDYECTYQIIKNKGSNQFLFASKIEIPYFIIINGEENQLALQDFCKFLKDLKNITAIQVLEPKILNKLAQVI